ncbi:MAG: FeoB-associated Cys-rich membrane protein [Lachnospiraceae bacterium]|nr:FeoB-associated Cys-rich membrane protein [Lachnospiraceae bacterium]
MEDIIILILLIIIVGLAVRYIKKEKKKGIRCIGCPMAGSCSRGCMAKENNVKEKTWRINQ